MSIKKLLLGILLIFSVAGNCYAEYTLSIESTHIIPDCILNNGVKLGGISDIVYAGAKGEFYIITDRGPNGKIQTPEGRFRTLLEPNFVPTILKIKLHEKNNGVSVLETYELHTEEHKLSGKPTTSKNGKILSADGSTQIENDPLGCDPEGLFILDDGFVITEEYGPSIMLVDNKGKMYKRYAPDMFIGNQENRGLESVSISPNQKFLWTMLQSPKIGEEKKRIVFGLFDLEDFKNDGKYRHSEESKYYYLEETADDGKICCMCPVNNHSVLLLEQSDTANAALFIFDISTGKKTIHIKLDNILPKMASDIYNNKWNPKSGELITGLKIEGMTFMEDKTTLIMVNDNDFNLEPEEMVLNNCLWTIKIKNND